MAAVQRDGLLCAETGTYEDEWRDANARLDAARPAGYPPRSESVYLWPAERCASPPAFGSRSMKLVVDAARLPDAVPCAVTAVDWVEDVLAADTPAGVADAVAEYWDLTIPCAPRECNAVYRGSVHAHSPAPEVLVGADIPPEAIVRVEPLDG